jgi:predicted metal-dependent HD superfamily phosphohydrolase
MKVPERFRIVREDLEYLRFEWMKLTSRFTSDKELREAILEKLFHEYSGKGRAYHNLTHVKALLSQAEALEDHLEDGAAVSFAIWFHDAIYDTRKADNEERSAEWATESLSQISAPRATANLVHEMILATKGHSGEGSCLDLQWFLDLDLSILGAPLEVYGDYSRAIRQEYSWVPWFLYRRERKKVLRTFLDREHIYFTDNIRASLEARARANVEAELVGAID